MIWLNDIAIFIDVVNKPARKPDRFALNVGAAIFHHTGSELIFIGKKGYHGFVLIFVKNTEIPRQFYQILGYDAARNFGDDIANFLERIDILRLC